MTNPPLDSGNDTGVAPDESYPGTPRWVKVVGIVVLVLVLLVAVIMATGVGGEHGPGRHRSSEDAAGQAPPAAGVQRP